MFLSAFAIVVAGVGASAPQTAPERMILELRDGIAQPLRLSITNACDTAEAVQIFLFGLPFIDNLPASVEVPAHETRVITATARPPRLRPESRARLEKGRVALAYGGGERSSCERHVRTWDVTVRVMPAIAPKASPNPPPQRLLATNPCTRWWLTGATPSRTEATAENCLEPMRTLAADYLERALTPLAAAAPQKWSWLPARDAVATMPIPALLAFRTRAAQTILGARQEPGR